MPQLPFNPTATAFDADNALYLATASEIAYANQAVAQTRAQDELGLDQDFQFFNVECSRFITQAFGACSDKHAVLSFRGTVPTEIKTWMDDLTATPTAFNWLFSQASDAGHVHAGFGHAIRDSWGPISYWLREALQPGNRTLWITGHSLGGALAVLAASACVFDPRSLLPVSGLYTYGQPRVGLQDFVIRIENHLDGRYFRFVNRRDLVPRVPFRGWDYADCGQMIHFAQDGTPACESIEWRGFISRTLESFGQFFEMIKNLTGDIHYHSIRNPETNDGYIDSIITALEQLRILKP